MYRGCTCSHPSSLWCTSCPFFVTSRCGTTADVPGHARTAGPWACLEEALEDLCRGAGLLRVGDDGRAAAAVAAGAARPAVCRARAGLGVHPVLPSCNALHECCGARRLSFLDLNQAGTLSRACWSLGAPCADFLHALHSSVRERLCFKASAVRLLLRLFSGR